MTDRELLRQFAKQRSAAAFQPFLDRYLTLVYRVAFSQLGEYMESVEVTRTVFQVFARKARRLPRKTILAGWLFRTTNIAVRKSLLLDHSWGDFYLVGSVTDREQASIWNPAASTNRFLSRVMGLEAFRQIYRARLEAMLTHAFSTNRLNERINQIVPLLRDPISADSAFRLKRFERSVAADWPEIPSGGGTGLNRPVPSLRRFIAKRNASVRDQLDGKTEGVRLSFGDSWKRPPEKPAD